MSTTHAVPLSTHYDTTWGDRLRRIRLNNNLDQRPFADIVGISGATVGKYELGSGMPRNHRLVEAAIELRFGHEAAEFLRGTPPPDRLPRRDSNLEPSDYRTLAVAA